MISINGLTIIHDYISKEQENIIMDQIVKTPKRKTSARNSIQRFGIGSSYQDNIVSNAIPEFLEQLAQKIFLDKFTKVKSTLISVNEYHKGQQIPPHIDSKESGQILTTLSLLSEATMIFQKGKTKISVELPPRCLVQMIGECRNEWLHSIKPVISTRYSIVFRY